MQIEPAELSEYVQKRITTAGSVTKLCTATRISRPTIYSMLDGKWPSRAVLEKLGIKLFVEDSE